jgi:hypothetical protein
MAPPDDVAAIASALDDLVSRWRAGRLQVGDSFDCVAAEFEITRTARLLHDVLLRAFAGAHQRRGNEHSTTERL